MTSVRLRSPLKRTNTKQKPYATYNFINPYASGAGIIKALRKPRTTWNHEDLGADPAKCGIPGSPSVTKRLFEPKREKIDTVIFSGEKAEIAKQFVDMLEAQHLI